METTGYLLSYKAAGKVLGCTERTIYEFVRRGELPSVRLGNRSVRVDPADLKRFIEGRKTGKAGAGQ
jgi:excisionase family DNA binding protein